jgi:ribosomal protein L30E
MTKNMIPGNIATSIVFSVVLMTPARAAELLGTNYGNRTLNTRHVAELVWQIQNGVWQLNPQPVSIDTEGHLIDGQHRLSAIVKADKPAIVALATNVPREARYVIDYSSKPRSAGDVFSFNGVKNGTKCSAIVRALVLLEGGPGTELGSRFSRSLLWAMYQRDPKSIDWAAGLGREGKNLACLYLAALAYAFPVASDDAQAFAEFAVTGAGIPEGSPVLLFNKLRQQPLNGGGDLRLAVLKKCLRTIHAFVTGEKLSKLQQGDEGYRFFRAAREKSGLSPIYQGAE